MKRTELLAPAGSFDAMKAAIAAGCDAVYIGGAKFGARAYADNPDSAELMRAIDYAHLRGKRLYLTVNTLLKQPELEEELYAYLLPYYEEGLDAVIVQDVGVMRFISRNFPKLPIHASTQMTLTQASGTKLFEGLPVTRLVPARELSLLELKRIKAETPLEIEAFVHGALCCCYSGQCLMSSLIGGRSGNRGRCAQPCRLEYTATEGENRPLRKAFLLSPKDLCTIEDIPELIEAGVHSFKIEGRMKRPEYTAGVTAVYRYFVDLYEELGKAAYGVWQREHPEAMRQAKLVLSDLYNRGGFTDGYLRQHNGKAMMSMERPNHAGVLVGRVEKVSGNTAGIRLSEEADAQDVLEIRMADGASYEFTLKSSAEKQTLLKANFKGGLRVRENDAVYRTKHTSLLEKLQEAYVSSEKKVPIRGVFQAKAGENCSLTLFAEGGKAMPLLPLAEEETETVCVRSEGFLVQPAQKQPADKEAVKRPLCKTNDTPFTFTELEIRLDGSVFLPNGQLNELRRTALTRLEEALIKRYAREAVLKQPLEAQPPVLCSKKEPRLFCQIEEEEQLAAALCVPALEAVYVNLQDASEETLCRAAKLLHAAGKQAYLVLPHIFRADIQRQYEKKGALFSLYDGFLVKNAEELVFLRAHEYDKGKTLILNYNLYVMNQEAKQFYAERGITELTAPVELNGREWSALGIADMTVVVYGRLPLMVSAQCIRKNVLECQKGVLKREVLYLTDRLKKRYATRQNCLPCYNTIYNPECLMLLPEAEEIKRLGASKFRLDFTFETRKETEAVLAEAVRVLCRGERAELTGGYTKGHYKRGVQ